MVGWEPAYMMSPPISSRGKFLLTPRLLMCLPHPATPPLPRSTVSRPSWRSHAARACARAGPALALSLTQFAAIRASLCFRVRDRASLMASGGSWATEGRSLWERKEGAEGVRELHLLQGIANVLGGI